MLTGVFVLCASTVGEMFPNLIQNQNSGLPYTKYPEGIWYVPQLVLVLKNVTVPLICYYSIAFCFST